MRQRRVHRLIKFLPPHRRQPPPPWLAVSCCCCCCFSSASPVFNCTLSFRHRLLIPFLMLLFFTMSRSFRPALYSSSCYSSSISTSFRILTRFYSFASSFYTFSLSASFFLSSSPAASATLTNRFIYVPCSVTSHTNRHCN